jgi:hypothetical protein
MIWIIFGLILLGLTGVIVRNNIALAKFGNVGRLLGLLFIIIGIFTACVVQIDAGNIGVKV